MAAALHFCGLPGSDVDQLGFRCPEDLDKEAYARFWSNYMPVLARRARRWHKVGLPRKQSKLHRFVRKGVPAKMRSQVWLLCCPPLDLPKYEVKQSVVDAIRLDLPRTFPDNELLSTEAGQRIIGRILFRVAEYFPDIGYCQGFNYIASLLYLVLNDEGAAVRVMSSAVLSRRNYYTQDMSGIHTDVAVLRLLLKERGVLPRSVMSVIEHDMELLLSKWLLCWFLETLPMESVLRVWDVLLVEGEGVLFRVAIALIEALVPALLPCKHITDVLVVFLDIASCPLAVDCHRLLEVAFSADKHNITPSTLLQLRRSLPDAR